jgi:hypothetical protein
LKTFLDTGVENQDAILGRFEELPIARLRVAQIVCRLFALGDSQIGRHDLPVLPLHARPSTFLTFRLIISFLALTRQPSEIKWQREVYMIPAGIKANTLSVR